MRYSTGVTNFSPCCGWPRRCRHTCRRPNRSKWLMTNVVDEHERPAEREAGVEQRDADLRSRRSRRRRRAAATARTARSARGCSRARRCCARSTGETTRVSTRLNAGRAMMLCCSANSASNPAIDQQRRLPRPLGRRIHRLRHREVADEPDGIKERREEHRIGDGPVEKREYATDHWLYPPW